MNSLTAKRLAISLMILAGGCGRASHESCVEPTAEQPSTAPIRRPSPEELKTLMPPRLQGPDGPYNNTRSLP
jgi:hypothetical protein